MLASPSRIKSLLGNSCSTYARSFRGATLHHWIHWILRIGTGANFIGHGAFGIIGKEAWLPYFEVAHIGPDPAWVLMRFIGLMDISFGLMILLRPARWILLFLVFWGAWTALMRPLAGQGWWEFWERGGNYGVPAAMLYLSGWGWSLRQWFGRIEAPELTEARIKTLGLILRISTGLLLIGHGGFGAIVRKDMLLDHFASIGILGPSQYPAILIVGTGFLEIALGMWVLLRPLKPVLIFIFIWKVFTELLYPISGTPIFEFIERTGSYAAPLGLFVLMHYAPKATEIKWDSYLSRYSGFRLLIFAAGLALMGVGLFSSSIFPGDANVLFGTHKLFFLTGIVLFASGLVLPKFTDTLGITEEGLRKTLLFYLGAAIVFATLFVVAEQSPHRTLFNLLSPPPEETELYGLSDDVLEGLQEGGYTIYIRHSLRDRHNQLRTFDRLSLIEDFSPPSFTSGQCLNEQGRAEAWLIGQSFERLNIPVGKVTASPTCRTVETAEIAFGRVDVIEELWIYDEVAMDAHDINKRRRRQKELLSEPPERRVNNVIVAHAMEGILDGLIVDLKESGTAIFRHEPQFELVIVTTLWDFAQKIPVDPVEGRAGN